MEAEGSLPAGYVSVGLLGCSDIDPTIKSTLVVRTDEAGNVVWQHIYDVGNDGESDLAYAVTVGRDASGQQIITVVGVNKTIQCEYYYDVYPGQVYIMQLESDGEVRWVRFYGQDDRDEVGYDIATMSNGDFVVAGAYLDQPWLLRTSPTGSVIWSKRYPPMANVTGEFKMVAELPQCQGPNNDLIACGWIDLDDGKQKEGWITRIDGTTGVWSAPNHGQCLINDVAGTPVGSQVLESLVELQNPAMTDPITGCQDVVFAGWDSQTQNMLFVRLPGGNPNAAPTITKIGITPIDAKWEQVFAIDEVTDPPVDPTCSNWISQWDLVVAGNSTHVDQTAVLMTLNPATLTPAGVTWRFSPFLTANDMKVVSFNNLFDGVVMTGVSEYEYQDGSFFLDERDLYIFKSDCRGGMTDDECATTESEQVNFNAHWEAYYSSIGSGTIPNQPDGGRYETSDYRAELCEESSAPPPGVLDPLLTEDESIVSESGPLASTGTTATSKSAFRIYPTPVRQGHLLTLESGLIGEASVIIEVFDMAGNRVKRLPDYHAGSDHTVQMQTGDLASGTYIVQVRSGERSEQVQVVIVE